MHAHGETVSYQDQNKTTAQLALWTLAWLVTLAVARFGPELLWGAQQQAASWVAVALNVLVGIVWIVAFARFLRALDDLWRKIMEDALAVTLGAGWVIGFAYVVASGVGLLASAPNVALFPVLLGVVYVMAVIVGRIRYR